MHRECLWKYFKIVEIFCQTYCFLLISPEEICHHGRMRLETKLSFYAFVISVNMYHNITDTPSTLETGTYLATCAYFHSPFI